MKKTHEYYFRVCYSDGTTEVIKVSKTKAVTLLNEIQCIKPVSSAGIIKCLKS